MLHKHRIKGRWGKESTMTIQFYINGELRREDAISPTTTVLDYLRVSAGQTSCFPELRIQGARGTFPPR